MSDLFGVDISHYQMDTGFDANKVKSDFIICKATQGITYKDPTLTNAITKAKAANNLLGLYHFADGKSSGQKEADFFLSVVKQYIGKALLILDWEADALKKGVSYAMEFCDRIYEKTGVIPIIYASTSVLHSYRWNEFAKKYPYAWGAKYGTDPLRKGYYNGELSKGGDLSPFKEIIRQYSANTYLAGYNNKIDADRCFINKSEWEQLCKSTKNGASKTTVVTLGTKKTNKPSVEEIATKIIKGEDGWKIYGAARTNKLKANGYDPDEVQKTINKLLASTSKTEYHTVQSGDTMTKIAKKYNTTLDKIKKLNPSIKSLNLIKPGMKIRIK